MLPSAPFQSLDLNVPVNGNMAHRASKRFALRVSAGPISGDSDAFPGRGVSRRPAAQLLVPWPAAGVERLRADRDYLWRAAWMDRIHIQTCRERLGRAA
jgi:hypothetical protein